MSKIKTRETVKDIKVLDRAAIAGERMKNAFIRSKNGTETLMDDRQISPSEYAEDKVLYASEDISHDAAHLAGSGIKTAANKGKEAFQRHRAEKAVKKLRERNSEAERPASEHPTTPEPQQTPANGQPPATGNQTVSAPERPNPTTPQYSTATNGEYPQSRPIRQGYQPVSTGDSGITLYSDADRMVEQGRELAKKKAKQKAETGRQIKQRTDKIARQPERTVITTDASPSPRQTGEPVRAAERPAQLTSKPAQLTHKAARMPGKAAVRSSGQTADSAADTALRSTRAVDNTVRSTRAAAQDTSKAIKSVERGERTIRQSASSARRSAGQAARTTQSAVKQAGKGMVKTAQKTIKTAQQTSKTAIKTAQATARAAQKTAQATAKSAKAAAVAAKATAKAAVVTAKAVAKAVAATVKTIIAGLKALVAAIAAGGWVAVLVIVIICLIALIACSCFGIFFSGEDSGTGLTMPEVVREINTDYDNQLESIKLSTAYDVLEMSGSRAVWKEALAIYAVKTTTDPENGQEVASMDDGKKQLLKDIFWQMNVISHSSQQKQMVEPVETDDGNGNIVVTETTVTKTVLYVTVSHKTAEEMADEYGFDEGQRAQLAELLAEENNSLWTAALYGIGPGDNEIVAVALSQIGNVGGEPYWSWYGFGSRVEWCACFVSWCANECGYIENGIIPKFAGCVLGSQWFKDRDLWQDESYEPRPGDIIFFDWDDPDTDGQDGVTDHVGIVERVEGGYVYTVEGNSGDSCRQKSYAIGYYEIFGYGTPAY